MANTFYTNVFRTQENVNKDNMNYSFDDTDQKLSSFFPMPSANNSIFPGVICTGIGTIDNQFGFNRTTNTFNLKAGILRFPDAISNNAPYNVTNQTASISQFLGLDAPNPQPQLTISSGTYYLIATLLVTGSGSSYQYTNTSPTIPYTVIAKSAFTPTASLTQVALCLITIVGTNVTISIDANCAINYGTIQYKAPLGLFQQCRLTGDITNPYGDTTGSNRLYFIGTEQGSLISLWDGSNWVTQTITVPGTLVVTNLSGAYDIYVKKTGATSVSLTQDTFGGRTFLPDPNNNGRYVNPNDNTKLFVGSINVSGGTVQSWNGNRSIWNLYNQVNKPLQGLTTGALAYNGGAYNNSDGSGQFTLFIDPLYNHSINIKYSMFIRLDSPDGSTSFDYGGTCGILVNTLPSLSDNPIPLPTEPNPPITNAVANSYTRFAQDRGATGDVAHGSSLFCEYFLPISSNTGSIFIHKQFATTGGINTNPGTFDIQDTGGITAEYWG